MKNNYFNKITRCLYVDHFILNVFFAVFFTLATLASIYRNDAIWICIAPILAAFYTYNSIQLNQKASNIFKTFQSKSKISMEYNAIFSVAFLLISISDKMPIIGPLCLFFFVFRLFNLIVLRFDKQDKKLNEIKSLLTNKEED